MPPEFRSSQCVATASLPQSGTRIRGNHSYLVSSSLRLGALIWPCRYFSLFRYMVHSHGAVFEFGDFAVGVQGVGGEDVGGGFSELERDEDAAGFVGIVGVGGQADRCSAVAEIGVVSRGNAMDAVFFANH
jgi:hypothetical protein